MSVKKSSKKNKTPLIIITGFLGAGKTTLLNNLLRQLKDKKIGVIVNEFGEINVDAQLIDLDKKNSISEISNGSIFCSCLSGSFVKTIAKYQDLNLDYLLVESSGMSRPKSLESIIENVKDVTEEAFAFRGMICIVDASNFSKIVKSLNSAREQVAYSDFVIINKTDLVENNELEKIESKINSLNPDAKIIESSYSDIKVDILENNFYYNKDAEGILKKMKSADLSRPENLLLEFKDKPEFDKFDNLIKELSTYSYRIKGFVNLADERTVVVDTTQNDVQIKKYSEKMFDNSRLVIFAEHLDKVKEIIKKNQIGDL